MAQTPAEKQRAYRQRLKEKRNVALKSGENLPVFRMPFWEWAQNNGDFEEFDFVLALAGIEVPVFEDDRGPEDFVLNEAIEGMKNPFGGAKGSLGRAEVMIGCFMDAAAKLALVVNRYKAHEIRRRLAELETSQSLDRGKAMKEAVRLNKMLEQLDTQIRWSFPQWKVASI